MTPVIDGSTDVNALSREHQPLDAAKSRKNPFGFIVDLFRPKNKALSTELSSSHADTHKTDISEEDLETSNGTTEECSEELCSTDTNFSVTVVNFPQKTGSSSLPGSKLSTPVKRQRDSEVLRSMEMIHLSREDNPVLVKIRNSEQSLLGSTDLGIEGTERVPPPVPLNSDSSSSEVLHQSLVRSPPPVIKRQHSPLSRENSLSPVPSLYFPSRSDYTRAQIENDAAEILALQNHVLQQKSQRGSQHSTPRSSVHGKVS